MSDSATRPSGTRGRGSYRGGRGGYRGTRNGTKGHSKSDEQEHLASSSLHDQGEIGELKRKYGSQVPLLREVCPGWSDEDLVFALNETNGDVDSAFDRISSGQISQWGEVKKKQPKAKENPLNEAAGATRGGRGRGNTESRGRGRGTERGRGRVGRGASQVNGTRVAEKTSKSVDGGWGDAAGNATEASGGWNTAPTTDTTATGDWASEPVTDGVQSTQPTAPPVEEPKVDAGPPPSTKRGGWASLFAKAPPAPAKKNAPDIPTAQAQEATPVPAMQQELQAETAPQNGPIRGEQEPPQITAEASTEAPVVLTPSKDALTESNVERLPDFSQPPASQTAASTVASTHDPLAAIPINTSAVRPGMSGYAASALKATSGAGRSASFQRRVMEQQEAVVMPSNQAVDRTAVQFGSMGLNGSPEDGDVDEEREEPETRMQMPEDSPAQPRASLPQSEALGQAATDPAEHQSQRHAPGLPPVQAQMPGSNTPPSGPAYTDPYRYSQPGQKAYDPFGQPQTQQPQAHAQAPAASQEPFSNQVPSQAQGQMPTAHDFASYYGANARDPYSSYYGGYGHSQDMQQRSGSAFGTSAQDVQSQYATSRPQQSYGQPDAPGSGQNTPNPSMQGHHSQASQPIPQSQAYGGYAHAYNAYGQQYPQYGSYAGGHRYGTNRPQFDDVRRQQDGSEYYPNQYAYGQNQQYSGYNKGMYGQPQQQYGQEYSSSPANTGGYGQSSMPGREAVYGRSGSAQPSDPQQAPNNNAFGGMSDPFARGHSGYGQQHGGSEDSTKYDSVKASGPSPAIGQSNRPGSAINNLSSQHSGQSAGYAQPQSHTSHQAFGGYPQYGGHQQAQSGHPQSTYGGYGSNAFANTYGYGSGRGWNGTYGSGH